MKYLFWVTPLNFLMHPFSQGSLVAEYSVSFWAGGEREGTRLDGTKRGNVEKMNVHFSSEVLSTDLQQGAIKRTVVATKLRKAYAEHI